MPVVVVTSVPEVGLLGATAPAARRTAYVLTPSRSSPVVLGQAAGAALHESAKAADSWLAFGVALRLAFQAPHKA